MTAHGGRFAEYATATGAAASAPASNPAPAASAGGNQVRVTSDYLNVRAGPGIDQERVGQLQGGQVVTVLGTVGEWLKINYNGVQAYVFAAYTEPASGGSSSGNAPAPATPAPVTGGANASGSFEIGAHIRGDGGILPRMRNEAGMTWVKYQAVMPGGAPDLSGIIGAVHANGMKILVGAIGDRGRANDVNYHKDFARNVAALASQGADAIEIWNEPNLDREWGGSGANQVNPDSYANLLRESYGAIKSVNKGTMVVSAAPAPTGYAGGACRGDVCDDGPFLTRVTNAGGMAYADCVGAHYNGSPNPPDLRNGGPTGDHPSWYFWGTLETTWNATRGQRPICWTELGYVTKDGIAGSLPGGFSWGNGITLQNQADWLRRAAELSKSSGKVRLMIIWNADFRQFDSDPQAGYSIFRPDGACPACGGLKAVSGR
jgi:hypothetical protein